MRGSSLLRFLDRYLGIPLIFILGLFRKKKVMPEVRHIGILKTAGIGDTVLLSGIVQDLKGYQLTFFAGPSNYEMAQLLGCNVVKVPVGSPLKAIKLIRQHPVDLWIDFGPWPRINALFSYFAKAKYRVGFKSKGEHRHFIYDKAVVHSKDIHEMDNFRRLIDSKQSPPRIKALGKTVDNRIALHMFPAGSTAEARKWPKERWVQLIEYLTAKGYECILTGCEADKRDNPDLTITSLKLKEAVDLLSTCRVIISVNTGILHLAAAMQKPVIAFPDVNPPHRWSAIGEKVTTLNKDITQIQVEDVARALNSYC